MLTLTAACMVAGCGEKRRGPVPTESGCVTPIELNDVASVDPDGTLRLSGVPSESLQEGSCGGRGFESVVRYVPDRTGTATLSTDNPGTDYDTVLYVRRTCHDEDTEIGCDDDGGGGFRSEVDVPVTAGEPIYIIVDSFGTEGGNWELTARAEGVAPPDAGGMDAGVGDGGVAPPPSSCDDPIDLDSVGIRESDGWLRHADRNVGGLWASAGTCGGRGPDSVLVYTPERSGTLTATTDDPSTSFDTVVYVRSACTMPSTELGCDDDSGASVTSRATAMVMAGVPVYIFVDGYGARSEGDYVLRVRVDDMPDAGMDAGPADGGPPDAGPPDAGPPDAGPFDAGPCPSGTADCDRVMSNGCETRIDTLTNCAGCGVACSRTNANATCAGSVCRIASCNANFGNCDGLDFNGCETSTTTSVPHCGGCGMPCVMRPNSTPTCSASRCDFTCMSGFDDCNSVFTDGCEADVNASTSNCGMCGNVCPSVPNSTRTCTSGTCGFTCTAPFGDCNASGADGCETNTASSTSHCGGCGMGCPARMNATATCASGSCGFSCTAPFGDCNASAADGCETNTSNDVAHCGGCGAPCAARANTTVSCSSGTCSYTCLAGFEDCDGVASNGCEVNLNADRTNCGMCGFRCPGMQMCCTGTCRSNCT